MQIIVKRNSHSSQDRYIQSNAKLARAFADGVARLRTERDKKREQADKIFYDELNKIRGTRDAEKTAQTRAGGGQRGTLEDLVEALYNEETATEGPLPPSYKPLRSRKRMRLPEGHRVFLDGFERYLLEEHKSIHKVIYKSDSADEKLAGGTVKYRVQQATQLFESIPEGVVTRKEIMQLRDEQEWNKNKRNVFKNLCNYLDWLDASTAQPGDAAPVASTGPCAGGTVVSSL